MHETINKLRRLVTLFRVSISLSRRKTHYLRVYMKCEIQQIQVRIQCFNN